MSIENVFEISSKDWNSYVEHHPKGSIFHTLEMERVYNATPGHQPLYIGARNRRGKIIAILAAVQIDTLGKVFSRISSRSIMFAEPICDNSSEGIAGLKQLLKMHDKIHGRKVLFTEIRPSFSGGPEHAALKQCGFDHLDYLNYVNDLNDGHHLIEPRIKKTLRKIRTSKRKGLTVERHNSSNQDVIERIYSQIQTSYAHSKVPLAPIELFKAAREFLPDSAFQCRLAIHENQDVAGSVGLAFKDRYFAWYCGTSRPKGIAGSASIVWEEIKEACRLGLSHYDFGGAGWPDEDYGPREFKSRFGGKLIHQGRYRKVGSTMRLAFAEKGYQFLRGMLSSKNSPISINPAKDGSKQNA